MHTRTLGRTGLQVSEIGFGAWAVGGDRFGNSYGPTDDAVSRAAIHAALDAGCTFFDTADVYGHGHSETLLGEVIAERRMRGQVVLATKGGGNFYNIRVDPRVVAQFEQRTGRQLSEYGARSILPVVHRADFDAAYIEFALEQSLRRLRTDWIDLYQLHNPTEQQIRDGALFDVLDRLKQAGKIRFYGASIHQLAEGAAAVAGGRADTVQVAYSLMSQQAAHELFPVAEAAGVGIIAREPLANGILSGKYDVLDEFADSDIRSRWPARYRMARVEAAAFLQDVLAQPGRTLAQAALRFALDNPAVSVVVAGAKTPGQVLENLAASALPPLTAAERDAIPF
jgi:aryl-alcohol dehydrogenase-like predicted oxidoreductase